MYVIPLFTILSFVLAGAIAYFFLGGFIWGAGYAPTSSKEIEKVARLLDLKKGDTFYDLGCGYGRMIISMGVRYGVRSIGIEADPLKCWWVNLMIRRKKLEGMVSVIHSNFLEIDMGEIGKAFIFLSNSTSIMKKLKGKMFKEMKPNSRVVSYSHRFADWQPDMIEGGLYLYSIP